MLFRRSEVPLERDASGRFLPWIVAIMVYLAALALTCALVMNKMVLRWETGLSGRITVHIPAVEGEETASGEAEAARAALGVLRGTPGVREVEILGDEEVARLLEPWLGPDTADQDLPLPTLIAVTIDPADPPDLTRLKTVVAEAAPGAVVDDHQAWLGQLRDLARTLSLVAGLVVLLVGACAIFMIVFATRAGLAVHGHVIELLHLIGAQDAYVAHQFQAHALKLALRGGVIGFVLAGLTVFLVGRLLSGATDALLPEVSLLPVEWSALAVLPLAVALLAMLTARLTVLRTLGRLP